MDKFTFIGVHINRQAPHFTYIATDKDFSPLAIDNGDEENLLSYLSGQENSFLAINAPLHLNQGLLQLSSHKRHTRGRRPNIRKVEYELQQHNIEMYHTPDQISKCAPEVKFGVQLNGYLNDLGYKNFLSDQSSRMFFETPSNAAFWSLIEGQLIQEEGIIGRMQRQQILYDLGLPVPNPMAFFEEITRYKLRIGKIPLKQILPACELNAWICVYTAHKAWDDSDSLFSMGNAEEGIIYLPGFLSKLEQPEENIQIALF
ncbi:MAG: DUF429 domain-containing protein [Anaerolineaceae bacterium]|nr:DUF429 domain-containing protein [Anaerolineaceae bacterium]